VFRSRSKILQSPEKTSQLIRHRIDSDRIMIVPRLTPAILEALRNAQTAEAIRLQQSHQSIRNLEAAIVAKRQILNAERNTSFVSRLLGRRKPEPTMFAMSASGRTPAKSANPPPPATWSPCATSPSASIACKNVAAKPMPLLFLPGGAP